MNPGTWFRGGNASFTRIQTGEGELERKIPPKSHYLFFGQPKKRSVNLQLEVEPLRANAFQGFKKRKTGVGEWIGFEQPQCEIRNAAQRAKNGSLCDQEQIFPRKVHVPIVGFGTRYVPAGQTPMILVQVAGFERKHFKRLQARISDCVQKTLEPDPFRLFPSMATPNVNGQNPSACFKQVSG